MSDFYLTIDDGPSEDTINKLKFLEDHHILAIWFCLGKNLEQYSDIAIRLIQKGHVIGNHSYGHPFFSQINFDECREQIMRTEKIIDDLYDMAGVIRPAKLFRFPYGEQGHFENGKPSNDPEKILHKEKLQQLLKEFGFKPGPFSQAEYRGIYSNNPGDIDWLWSDDIQEWAIGHTKGFQLTPGQVKENLNNYLQSYNKNKNQIILIHDHSHTARYFPELVQLFLKSAISFNLPELN